MENRLLLKTHKNEILEQITKHNLNPLDFMFLETESSQIENRIISKLVHKPTGYYFIFDVFMYDETRFFVNYFPTSDGRNKTQQVENWYNTIIIVCYWLTTLKREMDAPDLWATILDDKRLFDAALSKDLENNFFSQTEQQYISEQLRSIENHLLVTQKLTAEHRKFVADKFDYLDDTLKRMGRRDWVNAFIGVSVTIMLGVGLAPDAASELWRSIVSIISRVLGGGVLLP